MRLLAACLLCVFGCGRTEVFDRQVESARPAAPPPPPTVTPDDRPACCGTGPIEWETVCSGSTCRRTCHSPLSSTGCVASGGIDDTLGNSFCCSGRAVPMSTCCLDESDRGKSWLSCVQICG